MSRYQKSLGSLVAYLRQQENMGVIEEGQLENIEEAIRDLRHALKVEDMKRICASIDRISKEFLRNSR